MGSWQSLFAALLLAILNQSALATDVWVSPDGNDSNPGTQQQPLATISLAQRKARELRRLDDPSIKGGVHIILRDGVYRLESPLFVRWEDSGTASSPTRFEAASGEHPVLSGGVEVTGWRKLNEEIPGLQAEARGKVWVSDPPLFAGRPLQFRQMWVNGRKAVRARTPNGDALNRLLIWDRQRQEAWLAASALNSLRGPALAEMIIHQQWEIAVLRVKTLSIEGARASVTFQQPESQIQFEHPWPQPVMSTNGNAPFFLANAIEFLDSPDEWFQEPGGRVFYWPREGEDMNKAEAIAPALETLVEIEGSLDRPVTHVQFKGIQFQHTTWMRPSESGHVPLQAGMFLREAYKLRQPGTPDKKSLENQAWIGRPPPAVSVETANHILIERCQFEHLAATGLDFVSGTHDDVVRGNLFRDIGGTGVQLGSFQEGGVETHVPYDPSDKREICQRERIANNYISDCGTEDWGCMGIAAGYVRDTVIEHNELSHLPYSGISLGWGWSKRPTAMKNNVIRANHVHHVGERMCDLAGIYLLASQPGTVVSENCVHDIRMSPYVHDPEHWFYLYLDEGTSNVTVRDNWCPEERFLKNANGPGNRWKNNGPMVSEKIKNAAGLEPSFRDLPGD